MMCMDMIDVRFFFFFCLSFFFLVIILLYPFFHFPFLKNFLLIFFFHVLI